MSQRLRFPDPSTAPADLPLAMGGDLEPDTLLEAYRRGIFPWPDAGGRLYWWSPDPRAVLPLDRLHTSKTLRRVLRSGRFRCTLDTAFDAVVAGCADRPGAGTWITPEMRRAYGRLHRLGHAHSVEAWDRQGQLVGGVYGVALGAAFMAESMFHRASDASKVALVDLVERLRSGGFVLFDAQLPTAHLARLGAIVISREEFLGQLGKALRTTASLRDAPDAGP